MFFQERRAHRVFLDLALVDEAVYLNNKVCCWTIEVHYEPADGMLPPKLRTGKAKVPKGLPKGVLSRGRRTSELLRPWAQLSP